MDTYDTLVRIEGYQPFGIGYVTEFMAEKAKSELKETEEVKAESITLLQKKISDEKNLVCPMDEAYLLQYLRPRKFDVTRAFELLKSYYEVKKSYSGIYGTFNEEALLRGYALKAINLLPFRDAGGCAIIIIQTEKWDPDILSFDEATACLTAAVLNCVDDPATQVCGVRVILDVKGFSFKQFKSITARHYILFSRALKNCLPVRFKGIHIYNESKIFKTVWSIIRIILSEKIKDRIHFHGDNQKDLQRFIPRLILPSEYGGDYTQFNSNWSNNKLEAFLERYRELTTYGYTQ